jgi:hypothetical protein
VLSADRPGGSWGPEESPSPADELDTDEVFVEPAGGILTTPTTSPQPESSSGSSGELLTNKEEEEEMLPTNEKGKSSEATHGKMLVHSASFFVTPERLRRPVVQRNHSFFDENQVITDGAPCGEIPSHKKK